MKFDFGSSTERTLGFYRGAHARFARALSNRTDDVKRFFREPSAGDSASLVDKLIDVLNQTETGIERSLGAAGLSVDLVA